MSRSRKVCLLRKPAEIESLSNLRKLQQQVRTGKLSEDQAAEQFKTAQLPDCAHHHHLTIREAHQQENAGRLQFLSGWDEQYARVGGVMTAGRRFNPAQLVSGDRFIGQLEMYAT